MHIQIKIKTNIESVKKIRTKFLGVDNIKLYHRAKYQFKIRYILDYTKITNLTNLEVLKMSTVHHTQIHSFIIFAEPKI